MTQATVQGAPTFPWLTTLLTEANQVSDEQFKKLIAGVESAEDDEKTYELPREIGNLLVTAYELTREADRAKRRHMAEHLANLGEEDTDHSSEQCERLQSDASWIVHKITMLKSLFWVAVWEHLERPSKSFSLKKQGNTLVVVESGVEKKSNEDDPLQTLLRGGTIIMEGGLDLLSRLFR